MKICLTIAGLDPSGGAGIIADIKTFAAFGCFATAAVSSITFQNTTGVFGAVHQTRESVRRQIELIASDFTIDALKTGMLPTGEIIDEVISSVAKFKLKNLVVDPVVRSTSGFDLIDDAAIKSLKKLFKFAAVVTPNIPEAERLTGIKIETIKNIHQAAAELRKMGAENVLIKGGHFIGDGKKAVDYLFEGGNLTEFSAEFIDTTATHGTGCTMAAAIAANLALGKKLKQAAAIAKKFVNRAIKTAPHIGHGNSPINIPSTFTETGENKF